MVTHQTKFGVAERRAKSGAGSRSSEAAFTLVELLIVMGIIVILAGLFTVAGGYMYGEALKSRTKGTLSLLAAALEEYRNIYGTYPPTKPPDEVGPITRTMDNQTYDIRNVYALLRDNQILKEPIPSRSLEKKGTDDRESDFVVLDAWKNPLVYRFPRKSEDGQFDLWSMGPDGLDSRGANKADTIDPTAEDPSGDRNADNIVHGEFGQ